MKVHVQLLEYIIDMWDADQEHFVVGVHILPIEIEDIYFLTSLSEGKPCGSIWSTRGRRILGLYH